MQEKNKEISFLKKNILTYLNIKGVTNRECYNATGMSEGILSQSTGLTEDNILKFLKVYSDINLNFLFYGSEPVLKQNENEISQTESANKAALEMIRDLSAENALLRRENEELKDLNKKTSRSTDVPLSMVAEPEIGYKEKASKP